jgi:peroxiredoxin Q/BCP
MAFKNKHLINFALLSDTDNKVANLFGSWDNDSQLPLRHTFLINVDKKIIKEWREVDVANHADEVFDNL